MDYKKLAKSAFKNAAIFRDAGDISKAVDLLRYFKANASYAFYDQTAADIIRQIAGDLQIDTGNLTSQIFTKSETLYSLQKKRRKHRLKRGMDNE